MASTAHDPGDKRAFDISILWRSRSTCKGEFPNSVGVESTIDATKARELQGQVC